MSNSLLRLLQHKGASMQVPSSKQRALSAILAMRELCEASAKQVFPAPADFGPPPTHLSDPLWAPPRSRAPAHPSHGFGCAGRGAGVTGDQATSCSTRSARPKMQLRPRSTGTAKHGQRVQACECVVVLGRGHMGTSPAPPNNNCRRAEGPAGPNKPTRALL